MNNTTKYIIWLVVLVILVWGGYTLLNKPKPVSGEPIKIGSILILTGEGASWGEAARNGIDLAVEEINDKGGVNGRELVVIHEDDQSDPKQAVSAFKKLTTADAVNFIIGPNWSHTGLAVAPLAAENKVLMISPSLGVKEFNESSEYLFNTWPHDEILSRNLAEYVYNKGHRKVALFGAQQVWVKDQTAAFKGKFEELGGRVELLFEPLITDTDPRVNVLKLKNTTGIDAVIFTSDGQDITAITAKKIKEFGIRLPTYSITLDRKIISNCEGACDGWLFLTFLTPTSEFEKKYKGKYNREVEIGSDSAYDAIMILTEAMTKTNSTDVEQIKTYLASIKEYKGASGKLVSDGKRAFIKPYLVKEIIKGEPVNKAE